MYTNRKIVTALTISVIVMVFLSLKLIFAKNKFTTYKDHAAFSELMEKDNESSAKYGYSDILECLRRNNNFKIQCINIIENKKCNVEVNYSGDIKLLYNSLHSLSKSKNFLGINIININKTAKVASININFKKNK